MTDTQLPKPAHPAPAASVSDEQIISVWNDVSVRLSGYGWHEQAKSFARAILALRPAQAGVQTGWIKASDRVPLEADGEVFVRFTDGSVGTAWATYWHGASNGFAQWSHPDPDEDRTVEYWMKPPMLAAAPKEGGAA